MDSETMHGPTSVMSNWVWISTPNRSANAEVSWVRGCWRTLRRLVSRSSGRAGAFSRKSAIAPMRMVAVVRVRRICSRNVPVRNVPIMATDAPLGGIPQNT